MTQNDIKLYRALKRYKEHQKLSGKRKKKKINWTSSKLKTVVLQKIPSKKWGKKQNGREYLQIIYLTRDSKASLWEFSEA